MGYNRRALYLKRSAELVVKEYGGRLPKEQKELSKLPGIGWNTAGSILASAHNLPTVFIETNIRRVFIHFFFPDRRSVPDLGLLFSIEKTLDRKNPREWYHALMDYGAMLGRTIENPNRRSRHYVKQARFNGSKRQVRGKVLRALTQKKRVTFDELLHASESKKRALLPILDELMREGFIEQSKSSYTLAHD